MSWSRPCRPWAACILFLSILVTPAFAEPLRPEDPRDREIRELRQRVEARLRWRRGRLAAAPAAGRSLARAR